MWGDRLKAEREAKIDAFSKNKKVYLFRNCERDSWNRNVQVRVMGAILRWNGSNFVDAGFQNRWKWI